MKEGALEQRGMPRWPGRYATVALEHASHAHPRAGGRGSPGSRLWLLTISTSCERGRISIWALGLEIAFSSLQCSDTSEPTNNVSGTPKPPWTHLFRGPDTPGRALFRVCALSISPHLPERLPDPPHLPTQIAQHTRCPSCLYWHIGTRRRIAFGQPGYVAGLRARRTSSSGSLRRWTS